MSDSNYRLELDNQIQELKRRLDRQKHKVEFVDSFLKDKDSITIDDFVTVLIEEGYSTSSDDVFDWLIYEDFLFDFEVPNEKYIEYDVFTIKTSTVQTVFGEKQINTIFITPNGQLYLVSKYKEYINN